MTSAWATFFEPLVLAWHPSPFDFAVAYGAWMPTGNFSAADPVSPGKGFWSHMLTAGATWYPDEKKTWSFSVLNRYEFHTTQDDTGIRPGQTYTLEYGLAKALTPVFDLGVVGYFQKQTTTDGGTAVSRVRDHAAAIGLEAAYAFPKIMLFTSLRYEHEFTAKDRPQGNVINLTITKRF